MDLAGTPVVVVGLARSGIAAARLLAAHAARVVATDLKPADQLSEEVLKLREQGIDLRLGGHAREAFADARLVVVSPGVPVDQPDLIAARAAGVPVIGELELGYRLLKGTVAAVTGTKGKSTTTAALGAMLRREHEDVRVGGNIGEALTSMVEGSTERTLFVLEVSSFQLETIDTFHPHVAVFLNLSADHLDRHASVEEYAAAKSRIFANQTSTDWAVINADDPGVLACATATRARRLSFGSSPAGADAAFFEADRALMRRGVAVEALFNRRDVQLPGTHLASDLLAASAAARLLGASPPAITEAIRSFHGIEHVLEHVAEIRGIDFYNDSKATNVDAARKSIEAFEGPLIVILGGRYKGGDFTDLRDPLRSRGKAVLAIGEAAPRIHEALGAQITVIMCADLRDAVQQASAIGRRGDTVLLAPACSSFDMFRDYAERGRVFKEEVRRVAAGGHAPSSSGESRG